MSLYEVEPTRRSRRDPSPKAIVQGTTLDDWQDTFTAGNLPGTVHNDRTRQRMNDLTMAQASAARQQLGYQLRNQPLGGAAGGMTFNNLEEKDDLYSTHQSRASEVTPSMARLQ